MTQLSFNNYGSATTNGTDLGASGMGLSMGTPTTNSSMSSGGTGMAPNVSVAAPTAAGTGGGQVGGAQQGSGFWSKDGGAGMILGGVQVLGNLWSSFQAHKMAKKQMAFAREQWDTNLANQTQTYNTALEDRVRGRYAQGTRTEGQLQGEVDRHSL